MDALAIAQACLRAYVDKDRAAIEALLSDDFRFTSPLDDGIDRAAYFARCWPDSAAMRSATVTASAVDGDRAFVVYEADSGGKRFRNCELHTARDGRLVSVEVYFGWDLPHPGPAVTGIANALASVAVKELDPAAGWYARLLGRPGKRPMPEVAEWTFPRGGGLQVYAGAERAGRCSFTLAVDDIEAQVRHLASMQVDVSRRTASDRVQTVMVSDPDGNSIAFAQAIDPELAR